jgi:hypothetical protein
VYYYDKAFLHGTGGETCWHFTVHTVHDRPWAPRVVQELTSLLLFEPYIRESKVYPTVALIDNLQLLMVSLLCCESK